MEYFKYKGVLKAVNIIIIILHIVFFMIWVMVGTNTPSLCRVITTFAIIFVILSGVIYLNYTPKKQILRKIAVFTTGSLAVLSVIAYYIPWIVMKNFENSKTMYKLKRFDYTYGVYGTNADYYHELLPESLPDTCDDYFFRAQGCSWAQDYHAHSFLKFYTDTYTVEKYFQYYGNMDFEIKNINDRKTDEKFKEDFQWLCETFDLQESVDFDPDKAILLWKLVGDYHHEAVLLDRETGLVAIIT